MTAKIQAIYRYPVKGLSPESLARAELAPGRTLKADRAYAIENGPSGFDPAAPAYFPKQRFLMLMRNERLAALDTHFSDATRVLSIRLNGKVVAEGNLDVQIEVIRTDDEIGSLVESFNKMTQDLKTGKDQLEQINLSLEETNLEL